MATREHYDSDLPNQPWTEACVCGKQFMQPNSYALHVNCCSIFKARLGKKLEHARQHRRDSKANPQAPGLSVSEAQKASNRKPHWMDDNDLDVDIVVPPRQNVEARLSASQSEVSSGPTLCQASDSCGTSGHCGPLANSRENEPDSMIAFTDAQTELGKGQRKKTLSYKIKPNSHFLPSSTLPTSIFPPDALNQPLPIRQNPAPAPKETNIGAETPPPSASSFKVRTPANTFGLYKMFTVYGSQDTPHDPDNSVLPEDLIETQVLPIEEAANTKSNLYPFPNASSYRLGEWFWADDTEKSQRSFRDLVSIVGSEDFNPADVREANWRHIDRVLANSSYENDDLDSKEWVDDGISWKSVPVPLTVPFSKSTKNPGNHTFTVQGFHYRPLVPVIKAKLESSAGREYFHTLGHELRWNPGSGKEHVRVFGEMYNSSAFMQAYDELQRSPPEANCNLPRHIVGLMFASDATMLATFGTAKLWPLYMLYGNDSKYRRAKPSEQLFETVAYFEKLPDSFKDFLVEKSGKSIINPSLLTHCQRELFHEQWRCLLDADFVDAYCHGIVATCYDGQKRRFYPRILTYSADYPEKVLLASIKNLGAYPCPRCEVLMTDVPSMGMKRDRVRRARTERCDDEERRKRVSDARRLIYGGQNPVNSSLLAGHLARGSLVPTNNAFSERLSSYGFNHFRMLVIDLMHEVEIGVWKAIFIQCLRLLEAVDKGAINKLDERYRSMPTFGKDTIRRFVNNVSDMKQLAARDLEDLLQCAIAAFEGLLPPEHDNRLMDVLFVLAQWHGLAKLRLHTDHTLATLDSLTTELGTTLRQFVEKTCSKVNTKELNRKYQARKRRQTRQKGKASATQPRKRQKTGEAGSCETEDGGAQRKTKTLNLNTYKFHSLADVVPTIRLFGTTDSYSTQMPERFHRFPKLHYKRTSKKTVSRQLSRIQMRQARIRKLRKQLLPEADEGYQDNEQNRPYFIGKSQNHPINLPVLFQGKKRNPTMKNSALLHANEHDPAMKGFISKLKAHLLPRIYKVLLQEAETAGLDHMDAQRIHLLRSLAADCDDLDSSLTSAANVEADCVHFHSERIYEHQIMHINYTSYDVRRETDIVNPSTSRRNVMCLRQVAADQCSESGLSPHRFLHARVLGIFHANVIYRGKASADLRRRRFDFLFVRWFDFVEDAHTSRRLDRLVFAPVDQEGAVGFLDPADVLRASHILPRYSMDRLYPGSDGSDRLYPSVHTTDRIVSHVAKDWEDWGEYYVNRFVDRDMLMRYMWGQGVGHLYSRGDAYGQPNQPHSSSSGGTPQVVLHNQEEPSDSGMTAEQLQESTPVVEDPSQDTLEDLEAVELEVFDVSDEDSSDMDLQEPDDDLSEDDKW